MEKKLTVPKSVPFQKDSKTHYESNVISINEDGPPVDSDYLQISVYALTDKLIEVGFSGNSNEITLNKEQAVKLATLIIEKSREIT